ncbi:MAG: hypothetical protein ACOCP8_08100 [archaeon]
MKKQKKKSETLPVCQHCLTSNLDKEYYFILKKESKNGPSHYFLSCSNCCTKNKYEVDEDRKFSKPKKKKPKIDTSNWVEGEPTKKGNKRFIFINEKGLEVTLIPETGVKKNYKPKTKK